MENISKNIRKHMNHLCLNIGSKHCGSPELDKAGNYIAEVLEDLGYEVIREEFPVRGWEFKSFQLFNVTRNQEIPACCACYFSNSVDIYDQPLWLSWQDVGHLEELPVQGRLCFVTHWFDPDPGKVFGYNAIAEKLDKLGAAAAIFLNRAPHTQLAPSTKIQRSPFLDTLATVSIAEEGAIYMANHPEDTYHLKINARCFDTTAFNVIGRIGHGSKKGVVGAHYDTAPLVQGAQDDIGGTVIMMEMARLLKPELEKLSDEWTIDFAAFSAEEYIPYTLCPGSGDYVARHKDEDIKWLLNIDDVATHFAYPEIEVGSIQKLPPLDYPYTVRKATFSGDDKCFNSIGVPTIWIVARKLYGELHTAMDDLAHSDFARMESITEEYNDLLRQLTDAARWAKLECKAEPVIVPTGPEHYEAVADLAVAAWQNIYEGYREQLGDKLFDAFFANREANKRKSVISEAQEAHSYVALDGNKVAAFINFRCDGAIGELCTNAVDPAYRGQGIGTRLQEFALEQMKSHGCTHAFVVTGGDEGHLPARKAYERNGFSANLPSVKYFKAL